MQFVIREICTHLIRILSALIVINYLPQVTFPVGV